MMARILLVLALLATPVHAEAPLATPANADTLRPQLQIDGGLSVIGAGYGALGERIRSTGAGWTIDPTDHEGIRVLIERLDRCRAELMRATRRARDVPRYSVDSTASRYAALYGVPVREAAPAHGVRGRQ